MRGWILLGALLAAGCGIYSSPPDARPGAGRDGNAQIDAHFPDGDAGPASCVPTGSCNTGVECGGSCCNPGEQCFEGTCFCGTHAACAPGDSCATAGPGGPSQCGSICCGPTGGPCPL